jgi:Sortase domain
VLLHSVNMKFLANKIKLNNSQLMLVIVLFLSVLICWKSISLNLTNSPSFSFGQVSVQAQSISEKLGSTSVSGQAVAEEDFVKVELVQNINVQPLKPKHVIPTNSGKLSALKIPSIKLNTSVDFASVKNLPVLEEKLLYNALVENVLSSDFCTIGSATYVYGHSEPAVNGTENYPAAYIFKNLDQLQLNQEIQAINANGKSCSYKISEIFVVTTDSNDQASVEDYNKLFYPNLIEDKSILTLQTCVKGSSTERLIIRAISV